MTLLQAKQVVFQEKIKKWHLFIIEWNDAIILQLGDQAALGTYQSAVDLLPNEPLIRTARNPCSKER